MPRQDKKPAFALLASYEQGMLVTQVTASGKEVSEHARFLACPHCFNLYRGGGIVVSGVCTNCGWAAPPPEPAPARDIHEDILNAVARRLFA